MRDLVYIRKNVSDLLKQLRPTGRAFQYPAGSDSDLEQSVKSEALADYFYEIENFVAKILPDNDLFNEQAATDWERRLELDYDPDTLTLEERGAEINRKLSFPGGFKYTLTLEFIEYQLRASLFDVRVYRNPNQTQPVGTELIANSVDKEDGFTITNYFHTFIIAGTDINTQATIKGERRQEFIRKVLRYKPMNTVCFLNSTISKQDGTFKLKYNTYTCQRITETPPYATNVNITGTLEVGQTLTGAYTYNDDNGDTESGTLYQWFRADDAAGTNRVAIVGATCTTYNLVTADANKFIQFGVTPANNKSFGTEALSDYTTAINPAIKPVIVLFEDGNANRLTWTMSDNSQDSGTWVVQYSLDNGNTWIPEAGAIGTGSPRVPVLPVGAYNQDVYFRVKRISAPTTEYSDEFIKNVTDIFDFNKAYSGPTNIIDASQSAPTNICTGGAGITADNIWLSGTTPPAAGVQLYFKDNLGDIYAATKANLLAYPSQSPTGDITLGIKWCLFVNYTNVIWDVDEITGIITGTSTQYTCS